MGEIDETPTLTESISRRFDQLLGWAKAGQVKGQDGEHYYLMSVENVDTLRDDLIKVINQEIAAYRKTING